MQLALRQILTTYKTTIPFFVIILIVQLTSFTAAQEETLDLKTCIEIALKNNLELKKRRFEKEAKTYLSRASFKEMLPSIDTSYSYTGRRDAASITIFGHSTNIYGHETYKWNLNIRQPIFYGGLLWNKFKASKIDVDLASLALFQARSEIIRDVKTAFYEVLRDKRLVEEAISSLKRLKNQYETVKAFYEAALRPKTDLLQSQVELNRGELNLLKAKHTLEISKNKLNLVMKRSLEEPLILDEKDFTPKEISSDLKKLYKIALSFRPEINEAKLALKKAKYETKMAMSDYFPRIELTGTYLKEGITPDVSDNPYGDHENAMIFINASWQLFSWGKSYDKIQAARKREDALFEEVKKIIDNVRFQVKNSYLLYKDARKGIEVAKSALKSAQEDFELNSQRYKNQLATILDVLSSQNRLTKARSEYLSAIALELISVANLEYAIGKELKDVSDKNN